MKKYEKKFMSLSLQMLLYFIALLAPLIIILGIINYKVSLDSMMKDYKSLQNQTELNILNTINMAGHAYTMLDKSLNDSMKKSAEVFRDEFVKAEDPSMLDLNAIKQKLGGKMDLYILDDQGIVRYTTYEKDLNLDFKNFGDYYNYIVSIREGSEFAADPFSPESQTGAIKKYVYMPVPGNKYLLELAYSSEDFKDLLSKVDYSVVANELKKSNASIVDIKIFDKYYNLVGDSSYKTSEAEMKSIDKILSSKQTFEIKQADKEIKYIYVPKVDEDSASDTYKALQITYTRKIINDQLFKNTILQFIISLVGLALTTAGTIFISTKMIKLIRSLIQTVDSISNGDLSVRAKIKSNSELKYLESSINKMIDNTLALINRIKSAADNNAVTATQLSSSSEQTSQSSTATAESSSYITSVVSKQAQNIKMADEQIRFLDADIAGIKETIQFADNMISDVIVKSEEGLSSIDNTINKIKNIKETSQKVHTVISNLSGSSSEIGNITNTIESIASQTNLLALNAAIEAARAGESGKGFAVVADEVRRLAEQSTNSAKVIHDLITKNQANTSLAVATIEEGLTSVIEGEKVANDAGYLFKKIIELIKDTANNIQHILNTTHNIDNSKEVIMNTISELIKLSESISQGTSTIASNTQEQMAAMEEIKHSSEMLARMSEELVLEVNRFTT